MVVLWWFACGKYPHMLRKIVVVGPFQCNCQILCDPQTGATFLIDPGDEAPKILNDLKKLEAKIGRVPEVKALLHTHAHLDHIAATRGIKEAFPNAPQIILHKGDHELYKNLKQQSQMFGLNYNDPLPVDRFIGDKEEIQLSNEPALAVIHTPGHSPGSVCYLLKKSGQGPQTLFSGDTLFQGSVGRTDLWGANEEQMFENIHTKLLTLPTDTRVCPGHGPDSEIGIEKRENPFLAGATI